MGNACAHAGHVQVLPLEDGDLHARRRFQHRRVFEDLSLVRSSGGPLSHRRQRGKGQGQHKDGGEGAERFHVSQAHTIHTNMLSQTASGPGQSTASVQFAAGCSIKSIAGYSFSTTTAVP